MEFSEKLKILRAEKGVSQAKLAESIHISRSAIAKWENGLGLPSEDSLKLLAEYFGVTKEDLLPDKAGEETLVSKNKIIDKQKQLIVGLLLGVCLGLFVLAYAFIESLREYLLMIALGIMIIALGIFNIRGNIASIHWYNRRKVSKEEQKPYCRVMGIGSVIIGAGIACSAFVQAFANEILSLISIAVGLVLMLYAQFRYNKGIF
ncbi:MAG: helix-turn-helix transcriptional regulator [Clostridia bacterium]|nr:helix-turn-helix transcriptional regulator [Clostridia bacterium]